jgi:hypothetical protein
MKEPKGSVTVMKNILNNLENIKNIHSISETEIMSIYYVIFDLLTNNDLYKNYSINNNSILFHLNNIDYNKLSKVDLFLDKCINLKNNSDTLEIERTNNINLMKNTMSTTDNHYKSDLESYIKNNNFEKYSTRLDEFTCVKLFKGDESDKETDIGNDIGNDIGSESDIDIDIDIDICDTNYDIDVSDKDSVDSSDLFGEY